MNWLKRHGTNTLLVLALVFGLGLLAYPTFSDYWNSFTQSRAIVSYAEAVASLDAEMYEAIWNNALAYNAALAETGVQWLPGEEQLADYESQLNVAGSGSMGYIEIPKISVSLPIYHGIEESVLQTSIGHLAGTSLPAGGESSHCALSGHRGLPSAKLFSDLDKLIEGDRFILTVLDQTLTYEVDQIRIVEPTDVGDIAIEAEQDFCTLITCTPYGINSHRMLVRGHRVANDRVVELRITADALQIDPIYVAPVIAIPVIMLLVVWLFVMTGGRDRRRRGAQGKAAQAKGGKTSKPAGKSAKRAKTAARGRAGEHDGGKPKSRRKPEKRPEGRGKRARKAPPRKRSFWSSLWVQPGEKPAARRAASKKRVSDERTPARRRPIAFPSTTRDDVPDDLPDATVYTRHPDLARPIVIQPGRRLNRQSNEIRFDK